MSGSSWTTTITVLHIFASVYRPRVFPGSGVVLALARAVVDEGVGDARPRGERREIAALHRVKLAVDPGVDGALKDVDELFLVLLGVGIAEPVSCLQALDVEADAEKARHAADLAAVRQILIAVGIAADLLGDVGGADDERRALGGFHRGSLSPSSETPRG